MVSSHIFWGRFRKSIRHQWKIIGTVLDWTIVLYILIPGLVFLGIQYYSWWQQTPEWLNSIPLLVFFMILCFFSMSGNIQTYVESADTVFLTKKRAVFIQMKKFGYFLTIVLGWLKICLSVLVLLPFLIHFYKMSLLSILTMAIYLCSQYVLFLLINYYRKMIEEGWKKWLHTIFLYCVFIIIHLVVFRMLNEGIYYAIHLLSFLLLTAGFFYTIKGLNTLRYTEYDLKRSKEDRAKSTNFILTLSSDVEKPTVVKRNKPFLYKNSKRIFKKRSKKNGFSELFIKVFIRNIAYWGNFLRIISVFLGAILLIPPLWVKILLLLAFLIMINTWLSAVWNKIIAFHPVTKKYTESKGYYEAKKTIVWGGSIIAFIVVLSIASLVTWL